ncbi:nuclease-related domain-containing protein [Rossellomorea vietnamensis]|uniref:nuclease-related domain-containing protein n=1 Tax=Rossellomorea vietnamensis TaxID=218284 RepID=UPI003CEAC6BF
MIIKRREKPIQIIKLEALDGRLSTDHEKKFMVRQHLSNRQAGYKGEQSLDYYLDFLPESKYHIFHGLRLFDGTHYFQIDTLLLSENFLLILEIKRMAGILKFEPQFNQFMRITEENVTEVFPDPIVQVKRQKFQLNRWLEYHNLSINLPLETLVISTSTKAILQTSLGDKTVQEKVVHKESLPFKINKLESNYSKARINQLDLQNLSHLLLKSHSPFNPDILNTYEISQSDILTGVHCPKCKHIPMIRQRGSWVCQACRLISRIAHEKALNDYSLLINNKITNHQAREFLHIQSDSVTKRILNTPCSGFHGERKSRIYTLDNLP